MLNGLIVLTEYSLDKLLDILKSDTEIIFLEDVRSKIEMPPERDIRDSQPTISVNYRVIKNTEENNYERDKNYSSYSDSSDDWDNNESDW